MNKYKFYEEKAKKLGKQLLIENYSFAINPKSIEIFDKPRLVESSNGDKYTARAIIRNVPVSKFTENLNGRIYNRDLDERIIKEGTAEGTLSLVDHPTDEGSIGNICAVWHNLHLGENYSYADWYLTGSKGQDILEHIMAGAKDIGISRVGYGSFKEDNKTVDPADYILERLGDCVLNPSQEVFATLEQTIELPESVNSSSLFSESITNKDNNKIEEIKSEEQYTMLSESTNVKNNIRVILKEAKANKKSIKEAIEDIKFWQSEVKSEDKELHTYINNSLTELSEKMEVEVSNANKSLKEKEISLEDLKAKHNVLEKTLNEVTERYKKAQSIIESGGISDTKVLVENQSKMQIDINKLLKERTLMETDIRIYTEDVTAMKSDIKILMKERKEMIGDIKTYESKLTEAEKHIKGLEKILEDEYGYNFEDDDTEVIKATDLDIDDVVVDGEVYEPKDNIMGLGEEEGDSDIIDQEDGSLELGDINSDEMSYAEHYNRKYKEAEDDDDKDSKDDDDKEDKKDKEDDKEDDLKEADMDDKMAAIRAGKSPDDAKDDEAEKEKDKKDDDDKDSKDDKKDESIKRLNKNKVQESTVKINPVVPAVAQLFNEALRENKSLNDVKKQILESKTVLEASKKIQKFSEVRGNDSVSVRKKKSDDTVEYVFKR